MSKGKFVTTVYSKATFRIVCTHFESFFANSIQIWYGFPFKDHLPFDLVSGVVCKYMCGRGDSTYYGETDRHLKVRTEEYVGMSPLTSRKTKPSKENAICDHLLNCNNIPFFEEFTILIDENNKFVPETKEILFIKRDRPILNKNSSAKLFLFHNS